MVSRHFVSIVVRKLEHLAGAQVRSRYESHFLIVRDRLRASEKCVASKDGSSLIDSDLSVGTLEAASLEGIKRVGRAARRRPLRSRDTQQAEAESAIPAFGSLAANNPRYSLGTKLFEITSFHVTEINKH
jgi:hypothetical protein